MVGEVMYIIFNDIGWVLVAIVAFIIQYALCKRAKHIALKLIPLYIYIPIFSLLLLAYIDGGGTWIDMSKLTLTILLLSVMLIAVPIALAWVAFFLMRKYNKTE